MKTIFFFNDKQGFASWKEQCTLQLFAHYPLVELCSEKARGNPSYIYLAEISDAERISLLKGLFLYHLVDEIILYTLPVVTRKGKFILDAFAASEWKIIKSRHFHNGICRTVYRNAEQ